MKTLLLITALCLTAMAQNQELPKPSGDAVAVRRVPLESMPQSAKDHVAAKIEEARAFAEKAAADPSLIESTAKANRLEVITHRSQANGVLTMTSRTAEQLYQIQEEFGLNAATRVAQIIASLPTLSKMEVIK